MNEQIIYNTSEECFHRLDQLDPLSHFRECFDFPRLQSDQECLYFCGHSLGLRPKKAKVYVQEELDAWARWGVEAVSYTHLTLPTIYSV